MCCHFFRIRHTGFCLKGKFTTKYLQCNRLFQLASVPKKSRRSVFYSSVVPSNLPIRLSIFPLTSAVSSSFFFSASFFCCISVSSCSIRLFRSSFSFWKLIACLNNVLNFLFNEFKLLYYCFYIQHIIFILHQVFNITGQRFLSQVNSSCINPFGRGRMIGSVEIFRAYFGAQATAYGRVSTPNSPKTPGATMIWVSSLTTSFRGVTTSSRIFAAIVSPLLLRLQPFPWRLQPLPQCRPSCKRPARECRHACRRQFP
jgi:hypothetical protein